MSSHKNFMQRAIDLAYRGQGYTRTNPMVGAVIVYNNRIIGEGYHTAYGQPHAEIEAMESIAQADKQYLPESKLYVTLEPCAHFGKTPPCAQEIINRQIPNVFIGIEDPFPKVSGRGIRMMKEAGIHVCVGIEQEECAQLIGTFKTHVEKKRPFIHLKWAQSKDGFLSREGEQTPISRKETKLLVHKFRSVNDAILVGTNTLLTDNPGLDNRLYPGPTPIKLILDRKEVIQNKEHQIFQSKGSTIGVLPKKAKTAELYDDVIYLPHGFDDRKQLNYILDKCLERNIASILVEGGRILLQQFIEDNLWDRVDVIQASKVLGKGIRAPFVEGKQTVITYSRDDKIIQIQPN